MTKPQKSQKKLIKMDQAREACITLGYLSGEEFDKAVKPADMV